MSTSTNYTLNESDTYTIRTISDGLLLDIQEFESNIPAGELFWSSVAQWKQAGPQKSEVLVQFIVNHLGCEEGEVILTYRCVTEDGYWAGA